MFCPKCGATVPQGTPFCSSCGTAISASVPQSAPPPIAPGVAASTMPPQVQPTDGKAVGSLILGILSLTLFSILTGIPAIILGHISRSNIRKSMGQLKGDGMALAGLIMGYVSLAFIPMILIIAAIAIPNLLHSRMLANEAAAASTVRTLGITEITYATTYPDKGFAPDLATLGPGPSGSCGNSPSATYACLIDDKLGNARCRAGGWCSKDAFRYSIAAACDNGPCSEYVIVGSPVSENTGKKNYCSTSDGIVRYNTGRPIEQIPSVAECQSWQVL